MSKQPTHKQLIKSIKNLGRGIAIEVKTGRDKLTDKQEKFLKNWRQAGGIGIGARDIKTVADALDIPMLV